MKPLWRLGFVAEPWPSLTAHTQVSGTLNSVYSAAFYASDDTDTILIATNWLKECEWRVSISKVSHEHSAWMACCFSYMQTWCNGKTFDF